MKEGPGDGRRVVGAVGRALEEKLEWWEVWEGEGRALLEVRVVPVGGYVGALRGVVGAVLAAVAGVSGGDGLNQRVVRRFVEGLPDVGGGPCGVARESFAGAVGEGRGARVAEGEVFSVLWLYGCQCGVCQHFLLPREERDRRQVGRGGIGGYNCPSQHQEGEEMPEAP